MKRYTLSKWTYQSSYSWGLHSRLDTPILREVTTINACESYHSMIRKCTNIRMNLKECTIQIATLVEKRYEYALEVHSKDNNKISRVASEVYPQLSSWNLPYQLLVGTEITKAERMTTDGS